MSPGIHLVRRSGALVLALAALIFTFSLALTGTSVPRTAAEEPQIIYQYPEEGDVLKEPPFVLQMCFERPVNVKDLDKGGDFRFNVLQPNGFGLGARIVFQPDGYGVAIYPGTPDDPIPDGEWTWKYRLQDDESGDVIEGTVRFEVNAEEGEEIIDTEPPVCLAPGTTPGPTIIPVPSGTLRPGETARPGESPRPGNGEEGDDNGPDVLTLVLLTVGAAGAAALIAGGGYLVRRRIGFEPHKPGEGPPGGPEHH